MARSRKSRRRRCVRRHDIGKDPPQFFRDQKRTKKSGRNSPIYSGGCEIESFSKRNRVVLKAEIESFSKCPHKLKAAGGPGRTRPCNQTFMSGRLYPLSYSPRRKLPLWRQATVPTPL